MNKPIDMKPEFEKGVEWVLEKADLEKAVMWAELSLANCSWQTTDSNRIKVAEARENLAKFEESQNVR